jgi:hypothetical protein
VIFVVEISLVQLKLVFALKLDEHVPIVLVVKLLEEVVVNDEVVEVKY